MMKRVLVRRWSLLVLAVLSVVVTAAAQQQEQEQQQEQQQQQQQQFTEKESVEEWGNSIRTNGMGIFHSSTSEEQEQHHDVSNQQHQRQDTIRDTITTTTNNEHNRRSQVILEPGRVTPFQHSGLRLKKDKKKNHTIHNNNNNNNNTTDVASNTKIIGGTTAKPGQFLYFASTGPDSSFVCGAALIAPDILITAAHCGVAYESNAIVGVSTLQSTWDSPGSVLVNILKKVHPPQWRDCDTCFTDDILIMKISPPVTSIQPMALNLDANKPFRGTPLTIMGFGLTSDNGEVSETLQTAQVYTSTYCSYYGAYFQPSQMICVWNEQPTKQVTCSGDSGGPLVDERSNTLLGVLSYGMRKCSEGPGVFTRLTAFLPFLKEYVCSWSTSPPESLQCDSNTQAPPTPPPTTNEEEDLPSPPSSSRVCNSLQSEYQTCLDSGELSDSQVQSCIDCVNAAYPWQVTYCSDLKDVVCQAPGDRCGCGSCARPIGAWLQCDAGCTNSPTLQQCMATAANGAEAPTLSPTEPPPPPEKEPCFAEIEAYRACFDTQLSKKQVKQCAYCVNDALPWADKKCRALKNLICYTPMDCQCSSCARQVSNYLQCSFDCKSTSKKSSGKSSASVSFCGNVKYEQENPPNNNNNSTTNTQCKLKNDHCRKKKECCSGRCKRKKCK